IIAVGSTSATRPATSYSSPSQPLASQSASQHMLRSPQIFFPSVPPATRAPQGASELLVPLEYLQNVSPPRRDPVDEQLLRRFASVTPTPPSGRVSSFSTYHRTST